MKAKTQRNTIIFCVILILSYDIVFAFIPSYINTTTLLDTSQLQLYTTVGTLELKSTSKNGIKTSLYVDDELLNFTCRSRITGSNTCFPEKDRNGKQAQITWFYHKEFPFGNTVRKVVAVEIEGEDVFSIQDFEREMQNTKETYIFANSMGIVFGLLLLLFMLGCNKIKQKYTR